MAGSPRLSHTRLAFGWARKIAWRSLEYEERIFQVFEDKQFLGCSPCSCCF